MPLDHPTTKKREVLEDLLHDLVEFIIGQVGCGCSRGGIETCHHSILTFIVDINRCSWFHKAIFQGTSANCSS